jgi:hypothetical protein
VGGWREKRDKTGNLGLYHVGNLNPNPGLGVYYIVQLGGPSPLHMGNKVNTRGLKSNSKLESNNYDSVNIACIQLNIRNTIYRHLPMIFLYLI